MCNILLPVVFNRTNVQTRSWTICCTQSVSLPDVAPSVTETRVELEVLYSFNVLTVGRHVGFKNVK